MVVVEGLIDGDFHLQVVVVLDKVVEVVVELIDGKLAHGNRVLWKLLVEALGFVGVDVEVERVRGRKQRRKQQWPEVSEHCVGVVRCVCYCDLSSLVLSSFVAVAVSCCLLRGLSFFCALCSTRPAIYFISFHLK